VSCLIHFGLCLLFRRRHYLTYRFCCTTATLIEQKYDVPMKEKANFSKLMQDSSDFARSVRSHTIGKLGGSSSMGNFRINMGDELTKSLPRSYSASMDGELATMTPSEMGRQEMYSQVPFSAIQGMQKKEREVANIFASYAADIDVASTRGLSEMDKSIRHASSSMLILDEMEDAKVVTAPLIFTVIVVSASMFSVGYNTSVMNAPEKMVFPGHSITTWALAVAAFAIGGPFGSATGGKLADKRGRRGAMLIGIWIFLVGGLIQTGKYLTIIRVSNLSHLSPNTKNKPNILNTTASPSPLCFILVFFFFQIVAQDMLTVILARFIIGFASGYTTVLVPIYLGEVAPPSLRGTLGTLTQFAMVIGILFADVVAFPFATPSGWRVMFSGTVIIAGAQLFMSPFLLESPRWLLNRDPSSLRARYIIKRLRGLRNEQEVEREVGHFIIGESAQHQEEGNESNALKELWSHPKRRKLLVSCLILQMAQQLSGINAVFFYSTAILEGVIDNPLVGTTVIAAVK
jgi:MFS family permease